MQQQKTFETRTYTETCIKQIAIYSIIFLFATFLGSCSKEDAAERIDKGTGKLVISVLGITDKTELPSATLKANSLDRPSVKSESIMPKEMFTFDAFDAQVVVEKKEVKQRKVSVDDRISSSSGSGELMAAAMEDGITYRLFLYEDGVGLVASPQLVSGTVGELDVKRGATYHWSAVSFNNEDNIPEPAPNSSELPLPDGVDLLTVSGSFTIPAEAADGNIPLGIVFEHALARFDIEINTMGLFADMNSINLQVQGFREVATGFDVESGSLTGITGTDVYLTHEDFVDAEPPYHDRKVASFYSASHNTNNNILVSIHGLDIQLDNGSNRVFSNLAANPSMFNFDMLTQRGAINEAKVNLVESPLTLNTVRFARTNLYYHGGHNPYRFHHIPGHRNDRNTYFPFRSISPFEYGTSLDTGGDPCALVYPEGVWRTPIFNNYSFITPVFPVETFKLENGLGYFEYADTEGRGSPYPTDKLQFYMNGFGTAVNDDDTNVEISIASYGLSANQWTSLYGTIPFNGLYFYEGTLATGDNVEMEPYDYSGTGFLKTAFRNIRCARR